MGVFTKIACLVVIVLVIMISHLYLTNRPLELTTIELDRFTISCSKVERAGKRYLWLKDNHGNIYDSLSRVRDCEQLSGDWDSGLLTFREKNKTIYGLKSKGIQLFSEQHQRKETKKFAILFQGFWLIILAGLLRAGWKELQK